MRQNQPMRPGGRGFRLFRRDNSGASALEFALVAVPTVFLLLAMLEVGFVYFANYALENATSYGARLIRTGQAQTKGFDAAKFKTEVCKHLSAPLACAGLKIDVRRFTNFQDISPTNPLDSNGQLKTNFGYDPGVGGDVVVVRSFYEWSIAAKLPKPIGLSNMKSGGRLLAATSAFRNEPFE